MVSKPKSRLRKLTVPQSNSQEYPAGLKPKSRGLLGVLELRLFSYSSCKFVYFYSSRNIVLDYCDFLLLFIPIPTSGAFMYCKTPRRFSFLFRILFQITHKSSFLFCTEFVNVTSCFLTARDFSFTMEVKGPKIKTFVPHDQEHLKVLRTKSVEASL